MTQNECTCIVDALKDSGLNNLADFKVVSYYNPGWPAENIQEYWEVMLIPILDRIYLIEQIFEIIKAQKISVMIYTTINHAGCIIIH